MDTLLPDARRLAVAFGMSCLIHALAFAASGYLLPSRFAVVGGGRAQSAVMAATLDGSSVPESLAAPSESRVFTPVMHQQERVESISVPKVEPFAADRSGEPLPSGGEYYTTDQLTVRPRALNDVELATSGVARMAVDNMVMYLWIESTGEVSEVSVDDAVYPEIIVGPMTDAFKKLRFRPGEIDGQTVRVVMKIEASYNDLQPAVR